MKSVKGGALAPKGFCGAGVKSGLKPSGALDMAMICSEKPASCAGMFTTNKVCAAPVKYTRRVVRGGWMQAVIVNSGNANACTGEQGMRDAAAMARLTAEATGVDERLVGVASTGVIGHALPMDKIEAGIKSAAAAMSVTSESGEDIARAIMTTDTFPKFHAASAEIAGAWVRLGGAAKGAGMIAPRMKHATMLSFITTDAAVEPKLLKKILSDATNQTFNCVTVDGDTSTNDTVLVMANGASGAAEIREDGDDAKAFAAALTEIMDRLARDMARDGEGATKFIEVRVKGAASEKDARLIARAVAQSPLVKTAMHGNDPNWGRIAAAAGYSGARLKEERLSIYIGGCRVMENGAPVEPPCAKLDRAIRAKDIVVEISLGLGGAQAHFYTCDLSREYIEINAHYTT